MEGWKPSDPTASITNATVVSVTNGRANLTIHGEDVPEVPWFGPHPGLNQKYPVIRQGVSMLMLTDNEGHARGDLGSGSVPNDTETAWSAFTFHGQSSVWQSGSTLVLGRRGWWQVSMVLGWAQPLYGRSFLSVAGPSNTTGAGQSLAYRQTIGEGETLAAANALFYSDGTSGAVQFRMYQTSGAALTASGKFMCKYIGGE